MMNQPCSVDHNEIDNCCPKIPDEIWVRIVVQTGENLSLVCSSFANIILNHSQDLLPWARNIRSHFDSKELSRLFIRCSVDELFIELHEKDMNRILIYSPRLEHVSNSPWTHISQHNKLSERFI